MPRESTEVAGTPPERAGAANYLPAIDHEAIYKATEVTRWLLEGAAAEGGLALTQTHVLSRVLVREAAERWPHWWHAELFGPPHREADLRPLGLLHAGLKRQRLLRRRGQRLHATKRGIALAEDPAALLDASIADLGGGDEFGEVVAGAIVAALRGRGARSPEDLSVEAADVVLRDGWRDPDGMPPHAGGLRADVYEVLWRGEAYGVFVAAPDPEPEAPSWRTRFDLSDGARDLLGLPAEAEASGDLAPALIFEAELTNAPGVGARVAVAPEGHLSRLHDVVQSAFGWYDDHLYSFWLDGNFWGDKRSEYTSPVTPDHDRPTAEVPISELGIEPGAEIAYVFDFGDDWRVLLTLKEHTEVTGTLPRVLERRGTAPPQYGEIEEWATGW